MRMFVLGIIGACGGQSVAPIDAGDDGSADVGTTDGTDDVAADIVVPLNCDASGKTECSGSCVDVMTDAKNCGACGNACDGTCMQGRCLVVLRQGWLQSQPDDTRIQSRHAG